MNTIPVIHPRVKMEVIIVFVSLLGLNTYFVHSERIECGYQRCESDTHTCLGNSVTTKRCHYCSDFIQDIHKDCNMSSLDKGCSQYCIDQLKLEVENKHSTITVMEEDRKHQKYIYIIVIVTLGIFSVLSSSALIIFVILYCKERLKRRKSTADEEMNMDQESNNSAGISYSDSADSGINDPLMEQGNTKQREKDLLRQVKPKHDIHSRPKLLPSGRGSTLELSQQQCLSESPESKATM